MVIKLKQILGIMKNLLDGAAFSQNMQINLLFKWKEQYGAKQKYVEEM